MILLFGRGLFGMQYFIRFTYLTMTLSTNINCLLVISFRIQKYRPRRNCVPTLNFHCLLRFTRVETYLDSKMDSEVNGGRKLFNFFHLESNCVIFCSFVFLSPLPLKLILELTSGPGWHRSVDFFVSQKPRLANCCIYHLGMLVVLIGP